MTTRKDAKSGLPNAVRKTTAAAKVRPAARKARVDPAPATAAKRPLTLYARIGQLLGEHVASEMDLVVIIRAGLPATSVRTLRDAIGNFDTELVAPETTLRRRLQDNASLTADESERMIRIARVTALAEGLFEDRAMAHAWLDAPADYLRGAAPMSPLALAATDPGARLVESILLRVEHGMF